MSGMRIGMDRAAKIVELLCEGMSVMATARITDTSKKTILDLLVRFGDKCRDFLDREMRDLKCKHLELDEQWTYVAKKQSRLTTLERAERHDQGDVYLWTCIDQKTKLMPSFRIGKRSADNARRFMQDVARAPSSHSRSATSLVRPSMRSSSS